jgi:hypothetical protein
VWINTGRLGYSLRGRRGLSVRVGNTTIRRLILEERKQFRQDRLCNQKFTQELIFLTISSVICINKHVLNFTNVALLCVAKSLGGVGN